MTRWNRALVTGASSGVGRAIAEQFVALDRAGADMRGALPAAARRFPNPRVFS